MPTKFECLAPDSLTWIQGEDRLEFEANEDCLLQLLAMGISLNGAKKALYRTGNVSVASASNWIFDHPEVDLETPVEEEIRMEIFEAEEEQHLEGLEDDEDSDEEKAHMEMIMHQRHQQLHAQQNGMAYDQDPDGKEHSHETCSQEGLEEDEMDEKNEEHMMNGSMNGHHITHQNGIYYVESDEDTEPDSDFLSEDYRVVFVVNTSLDMGAGKTAAQVAQTALGLQRVLESGDCNKIVMYDIHANIFGQDTYVYQGDSTQHLKDLNSMAEDLELPCFLTTQRYITDEDEGVATVFGVYGDDEDMWKLTGRLKKLN